MAGQIIILKLSGLNSYTQRYHLAFDFTSFIITVIQSINQHFFLPCFFLITDNYIQLGLPIAKGYLILVLVLDCVHRCQQLKLFDTTTFE